MVRNKQIFKEYYFTVTLLFVAVAAISVSFVDEPVRLIGLTVPLKQEK